LIKNVDDSFHRIFLLLLQFYPFHKYFSIDVDSQITISEWPQETKIKFTGRRHRPPSAWPGGQAEKGAGGKTKLSRLKIKNICYFFAENYTLL
jgi:hypothetical protein